MSNAKKQLVGSLEIASLLCAEVLLVPIAARATTPKIPIRLSQLQQWRQTYDCGNFAITLSQQGTDRYTYEAVDAKGQKLTISNGTHHSGRNYSSIYSFSNDGSEYVLEDFGGGKAALSIGSYPDTGVTYDCTTNGNP